MIARRITLTDFRNYENVSVSFDDRVNVIYGDNAQGKTNLLEAVYLFSVGRSNRTFKEAEMICHGKASAKAEIEFFSHEREQTAKIELSRNKRKLITANDVPVRKNSELLGRFNVVYFGPELLGLVKEGPSKRRKNLDVFISQLKPNYFSAAANVRRIIESKNALLKMPNINQTMVEIMNEKLVRHASEMIAYRRQYINQIGTAAAEIQKNISGGREELSVNYISAIGDLTDVDNSEIPGLLTQKLEASFKREIENREAIIGPHREDIIFEIDGKDARSFASQGQQKTIVLVEKLGEAAIMQSETGEIPVLLLDDIMSEFDKKRQAFILKEIPKIQILLTCTDRDGFEIPSGSRYIYVENGGAEICSCT